MTEKFVYLGYGITDSNGIAKLDHDANGDAISHSYTGTGAGKIDVVGSLKDISDLTINLNPSTINDNSSETTHTITATVLDDNVAVQNEKVTFEVRKQSDNSLVTTLTCTTNSSGVATVSYSGIGAGVLNIKCYCSFVSETFVIYDRTFFDASSSSKLSNYTVTGSGAMTYDSTNEAYLVKVGTTTENSVICALNSITFSNNCEIECDYKLISADTSTNTQVGIRLNNNDSRIIASFTNNRWITHNSSKLNPYIANGNWYHIKMTVSNGQSHVLITQGDTTIWDSTVTAHSSITATGNVLKLVGAHNKNRGGYFKNISVQEL